MLKKGNNKTHDSHTTVTLLILSFEYVTNTATNAIILTLFTFDSHVCCKIPYNQIGNIVLYTILPDWKYCVACHITRLEILCNIPYYQIGNIV